MDLTIDPIAAFYLAAKAYSTTLKPITILEVDLRDIPKGSPLVDLSCDMATRLNGIQDTALRNAMWATSQVRVTAVPMNAFTGRAWRVDKTTLAGSTLLAVQGKDQLRKSGGALQSFGSYGRWREVFAVSFDETLECEELKSVLVHNAFDRHDRLGQTGRGERNRHRKSRPAASGFTPLVVPVPATGLAPSF